MRRTKYNVALKRKRKGKTNYRKRLKLLLSDTPRLVVRKSLKNISVQVIAQGDRGDEVVVSAHSGELGKLGWKTSKGSLPAAYLTGLLAGKKADNAKIKNMVLDIGLQKSVRGSRVYAILKGVIDCGIDVSHSDDVLPKKERIRGEHIAKYAALLKKDKEKYEKVFSDYVKKGMDPEKLPELFDGIKRKLESR